MVYPDFMGDKINLLWLVPLKEEDFLKLKEIGTEKALELLDGCRKEISVFDGTEKPAAFNRAVEELMRSKNV